MNWEAIGAISELLGALAVIVTLIYLTRQVREAAKANALNAFQTNRKARQDLFILAGDSTYFPALIEKYLSGNELNFQERFRLDNYFGAFWSLFYSDWGQRVMGVDRRLLTREEKSIGLGPGAIEYWKRAGCHIYPDEFVVYVNELLVRLEKDA